MTSLSNRITPSKLPLLIASLLMICITLPLWEGCSGKYQRPDNDVVFWHAMGGRLGQVLIEIIDNFNEQNPDIKVRPEYMGSYSSLRQKIIASLAAGNNPDLAQSFETWTSKFVSAQRIVPMTDFLAGPYGLDKDSLEDIFPAFRMANTYQGVLWALPFNKSVPVMYYNEDLLTERGLDIPADDWTWFDFLEYAHALTFDENNDGQIDQYAYANTLTEWLFQCLLHQNGGSELNRAETRITFAQPPGIKALTFILGLIDTEKIAYYSTGFNNQNDFAARKVAMISSSCASRIYLEPVIRFNWNCAPLPRGDRPAATVSGTNIVIFRQKSQTRMNGAWRFARYFTSTDVTLRWSLATGYLPVRKSAVASNQMREAIKQNPRIQASLKQLEYTVPSPKHEVWAKSRELLLGALEQSMIGNIPPEKSLTEAARKAQILLDRYYKP